MIPKGTEEVPCDYTEHLGKSLREETLSEEQKMTSQGKHAFQAGGEHMKKYRSKENTSPRESKPTQVNALIWPEVQCSYILDQSYIEHSVDFYCSKY